MSGISTPTAILVGSVVIGLSLGAGAYLGLRQRGPVPSSPSAVTVASALAPTTTVPGEVATGGGAPAPAAPAPPPPATPDAVEGQVSAILESARKDLVDKCWTPTASKPGPTHETVYAHVVFGPDGQELGRSILERGAKRQGVATCVGFALPPLHIPPPGAKMTLEVPFTLP